MVILKWNGSTWTTQASGTTQNLSAVWGSDASNVWAAGAGGAIVKWNGTSWMPQASGTIQYLRGLWGTGASSVWAVGAGGTILKWDGTTWTTQASGTIQYLRSIWGTDASNIWAVGLMGTILLRNEAGVLSSYLSPEGDLLQAPPRPYLVCPRDITSSPDITGALASRRPGSGRRLPALAG